MTRRRPPRRIEVGDLVLRKWRSGDADAITEAVVASLDHLRPWMAWAATEPLSARDRRRLLAGWAQAWRDRTEFSYGLYLTGKAPVAAGVIGGASLMARIGPGGWEIGYWVHVDRIGHGYASAAAGALADAAFRLRGTTHVEIHHDTANVASGRVPPKLGFRLVGDEPRPRTAPSESGVLRIWRLTRDEWRSQGSRAASALS